LSLPVLKLLTTKTLSRKKSAMLVALHTHVLHLLGYLDCLTSG
jgi:hypothetical protein